MFVLKTLTKILTCDFLKNWELREIFQKTPPKTKNCFNQVKKEEVFGKKLICPTILIFVEIFFSFYKKRGLIAIV